MQTFICEICQRTYPSALLHEHHKIPQSLGGPDTPDNIANLCQTDHQALHTISFMMVNPKRRHEIDPTLVSLYPQDAATRRRMTEFAQLVARELVLKKEIRKEASEEIKVMIELPARYLELLKLAAYDSPSKTGRAAGVGRLIRYMVSEALCRKFPMRKEEILALKEKKKS
jgi:HNH endonuclease